MSEYEVVGGMLAEWTDQCTCGSPVNQGFPHERGCGLEPVAPVDQILADLADLNRLRARVAELETAASASPDDAPTTKTHTEWRVSGTSPNGHVDTRAVDERDAQGFYGRWTHWGWSDVVIESRTVSTTTRTTDWKAEQV